MESPVQIGVLNSTNKRNWDYFMPSESNLYIDLFLKKVGFLPNFSYVLTSGSHLSVGCNTRPRRVSLLSVTSSISETIDNPGENTSQ